MAEEQLDKLSLDMKRCEKDGYGVSYGRWKATQPIIKRVPVELPEGWKVCPRCGIAFKPKVPQQKYCDPVCAREAQRERKKEKPARA